MRRGSRASDRPQRSGGNRRLSNDELPLDGRPPLAGPRSWGGVARRGAGREAAPGDGRRPDPERSAPPPNEPERWERVEDVRTQARKAVSRGAAAPGREASSRRRSVPDEAAAELARDAGSSVAPKLAERLADASRAYERGRYPDARRMLSQLAERAPSATAVRELLGLTLYRLGKWREAAAELEAFRSATASVEQHPVLADCYRALRRYDEVDELWRELREVSPSAELVAEGRIVAAGAMADRGDLRGAIALIEPAVRSARKPKEHQLRMTYVLADLQERAGDVPRARSLFERIATVDPELTDAAERAAALG